MARKSRLNLVYLRVVNPNCAGIDVEQGPAFRGGLPENAAPQQVRSLISFTRQARGDSRRGWRRAG